MNKKYLTIHGHFYQPPRENPWIEEIEAQDSAYPDHDWNEKITYQCYAPNGASRIVDSNNFIIEISNNYSYMSYNFGPTLLSWMEIHNKTAYDRIIQADIKSRELYGGHGSAIAQVYNHMILPLANRNDKITQVLWGLRDFQKRFGRNSEGIWLAETAVDAQTLEVLIDCGVKFTILAPSQAKCINKIGERNWQDVSWGTIDPSRAYRYFVEGTDKQKYIDLFFYDGAISKSVAFDNLLMDGRRFIDKLDGGYVDERNHPQLVNIATDGESYGHHTQFGDMALAYVLKVGAKEKDFTITNYAQFLEMFPPEYEVDIKPVSAWSCAHGVGRWQEDCGCSTGAQPHWHQRWRKPLRQALDYLRDELIQICSIEGTKYYNNFWEARNNYIDVILDRSDESVDKFFKDNAKKNLTQNQKTLAIKLMEMQRFCQLMYTSCGWFFADISGIETTQILKYAYRAMELASEFSNINFEKQFLSILQKAKSNIFELGSGRDIFNNFVKPSAIGFDRIGAQFAIESMFKAQDKQDISQSLYCFKIKNNIRKKYKKGGVELHFSKIEITSTITLEKKFMTYVVLTDKDCDFHCAIKDFKCMEDFNLERNEILSSFEKGNIKDTLKTIKVYFDKGFYTLKDIPIDRRRTILENLITSKVEKATKIYKDMYNTLISPITYLSDLGMEIPEGFRICAKYTLLSDLMDELKNLDNYHDKKKLRHILEIVNLTDKFNIKISTPQIKQVLSQKLFTLVEELRQDTSEKNAKELFSFFKLVSKMKAELDITNSQNMFYDMFCSNFEEFCNNLKHKDSKETRKLLLSLIDIGRFLSINMDFYREKIDSLTSKITSA